jgi:uncharacterized membrane protein YeaQ/YmgE (transglycosylase-associated protein family)
MSLIAWLVVGAIAGWVAGRVVPGAGDYGVLGSLIAGIVGAVAGGFIFSLLTSREDWLTGFDVTTLIVAIVGAIVVSFLWQTLSARRAT